MSRTSVGPQEATTGPMKAPQGLPGATIRNTVLQNLKEITRMLKGSDLWLWLWLWLTDPLWKYLYGPATRTLFNISNRDGALSHKVASLSWSSVQSCCPLNCVFLPRNPRCQRQGCFPLGARVVPFTRQRCPPVFWQLLSGQTTHPAVSWWVCYCICDGKEIGRR